MNAPMKITAILTARPGKVRDLVELLTSMAPHCRSEAGNLRWDIWQDQPNRERYMLDELYVDARAVPAHRETAHYQHYLAQIPDLADRTALVCDAVAVDLQPA